MQAPHVLQIQMKLRRLHVTRGKQKVFHVPKIHLHTCKTLVIFTQEGNARQTRHSFVPSSVPSLHFFLQFMFMCLW